MSNRRIIAAHHNGRSVVIEDKLAPGNSFDAVPGFNPAVITGKPVEEYGARTRPRAELNLGVWNREPPGAATSVMFP